MSLPLANIQTLLLELISRREVTGKSMAQLDDDDWATLMSMVDQHRLGPLLHWQLGRHRGGLSVPPAMGEMLAKSFKDSTFRSLMLQRELLLVHRILDRAGIPSIALKGAYLAYFAYPNPGLRPMRDLDILVSKEQALRAYQALRDSGYTRDEEYPGDPEACIKTHKHLPPLNSPSGQVCVELHASLFMPESPDIASPDPINDYELFDRCLTATLAQESIRFLSPTDTLLHLIIHAVYDHQFNNGPLFLSDLAYLLESQAIDWPLFWKLAERGHHTQGGILALQLFEYYWGSQPIDWLHKERMDSKAGNRMELIARLMLQDFATRKSLQLTSEVGQHSSAMRKLLFLLLKLFPSRSKVASHFDVPEKSFWIYAYYPVRWWWLVARHVPELFHYIRQRHLHTDEEMALSEVKNWLEQ